MADNYLENQYEQYQARKATIHRQSYTCWGSSTEVPETLYK